MIFVGPILALFAITGLICAGIANFNRYDVNDPEYWEKRRKKKLEWERRQTRNNTYNRIWK